MIKFLVVAALVAVSAAEKNEENEKPSQTYLRPEYIKPHEPYHRHRLHHHRREHEVGRYHHNYAGNIYHKEGYRGLNPHHDYRHEEAIPHHTYNPYLERKLELDHIYAHQRPIVYNEPHNYIPHVQHSPLHKLDHTHYNGYGHEYGYVPVREAYHNISPYLDRKVEHEYPNYGYDHGHEHGYGYVYARN